LINEDEDGNMTIMMMTVTMTLVYTMMKQ